MRRPVLFALAVQLVALGAAGAVDLHGAELERRLEQLLGPAQASAPTN